MSEILRRLTQRDTDADAELEKTLTERRDFCIQNLPRISREAIDAMVETDFKSANIEHTELKFTKGNHAAWRLTYWPQDALPHDVKSYEVYLLDTADLISVTSYWSGDKEAGFYDPLRYELPLVNVVSVYQVLADLPGIAKFNVEHLKELP